METDQIEAEYRARVSSVTGGFLARSVHSFTLSPSDQHLPVSASAQWTYSGAG